MSEVNSEHSSEKPRPVSTENLTQQPPAVAEKPSVSIRKIEANRLNALKATGPKTARGKSYSRRNATKHGLLAREIVFAAPDGFAGKNELPNCWLSFTRSMGQWACWKIGRFKKSRSLCICRA
jgi:hypothetical protein